MVKISPVSTARSWAALWPSGVRHSAMTRHFSGGLPASSTFRNSFVGVDANEAAPTFEFCDAKDLPSTICVGFPDGLVATQPSTAGAGAAAGAWATADDVGSGLATSLRVDVSPVAKLRTS